MVKKKKSISKPQAPKSPTISPLIGISVDKGVFIAVLTNHDDAALTDFRMATDRPFLKMLPASAARCKHSDGIIRDEKAGVDRRAYVAFIPVPAKAIVRGNIPFGAKVGDEPVFFAVPTEQLGKIDGEKLRKILYVLHPQFEAVLTHVLPEDHDLVTEFAPVTETRRRNDHWLRVQAEVKRHLEAKAAEKALSALEPLVLTPTPMPEAEKLLGEMLWVAKRPKKENGDSVDEESPEIKALRIEQLLLEFTVARLVKPKSSTKATRKIPRPRSRIAT